MVFVQFSNTSAMTYENYELWKNGIYCFIQTGKNAKAASNLYYEEYPERKQPFRDIFARLRHNLIDGCQDFGNNWIAIQEPNRWPAKSPDLTPQDFYLWGRLRDLILKSSTNFRHNLEVAVMQSFVSLTSIESNNSTINIRLCIGEAGGHSGYLLWWYVFHCLKFIMIIIVEISFINVEYTINCYHF